MKWRKRTLDQIAEMICGNCDYFIYRSSSYLTRFFEDAETDYRHDGSTRSWWVSSVLEKILAEPHPDGTTPPAAFCRVIKALMDKADADQKDPDRTEALKQLNASLRREGFEAFYGPDDACYVRHTSSGTVAMLALTPHRPFSKEEIERRERMAAYLDKSSEDELIEYVLLPLFRQLGFHRITVAGHKDKALEYGKDIWMRFALPTQHILYFGIQAKRGKIDASGVTKAANANVAELFNQATMMLGHQIFDPEANRKVLVDHAFIIAGGEITKSARNWLGNKLDSVQRSQIMFMDRDDILNLYVVTNLPLPVEALPPMSASPVPDEIPF